MTVSEIEASLTVSGYQLIRSEDLLTPVPFDKSVRAIKKTYRKAGVMDVALWFPDESKTYTIRQLNHLHKRCMERLGRVGLNLPADVLGVMKHCS